MKGITEKKGEHDMCKAIEDMINDGVEAGKEIGKEIGRQEGEIIGAVKMCKDLDVSKDETVKRVSEKFQLAKNQAEEYVEQYWG
ncbi:MAG: hypothetical protein IJB96_08610 [Lachnospira sp.]|nr:hypothetical protein [Lachnospira sp.]